MKKKKLNSTPEIAASESKHQHLLIVIAINKKKFKLNSSLNNTLNVQNRRKRKVRNERG